jgi:RNA polymerase sigma-70 factor (ECF subfamily)
VANGSEEQSDEVIAAGIAAGIRAGSRDAEAEMVRRYGNGLLYLLKRRTRDPEAALDLRQETFRVAIEKLRVSGLEQPERLAAYLRGIALNLLIAQRRKDVRRATSPDSDAIDAAADDQQAGPFEETSSDQVRQVVTTLLQELRTPRDREILKRLYIDDEDKDDICAALGVDSLHFNRVLFRAKERFRELVIRAERKGKLHIVPPGITGRDEAL